MALVSVTAADAVLTTDAIQSSGFYLFFAAVAAVASKYPQKQQNIYIT